MQLKALLVIAGVTEAALYDVRLEGKYRNELGFVFSHLQRHLAAVDADITEKPSAPAEIAIADMVHPNVDLLLKITVVVFEADFSQVSEAQNLGILDS